MKTKLTIKASKARPSTQSKRKQLVAPFRVTKSCKLSDGSMIVEGYGSAFNVLDSDDDVVIPGAYKKSIKDRVSKNLVKFLWQHDPNNPIGSFVDMREDEKGLYFKAVIADTDQGIEAYKLLKSGAVDRFSIGYEAIKSKQMKASELGIEGVDRDVNVLEEVKLYEISAVTFASNEEAILIAVKSRNKWMTRSRKAMGPGSFVPWSGGFGVIDRIETEPFEASDGSTVEASEDAPIAIINVWEQIDGEWAETGEVLAIPLAELPADEARARYEAEGGDAGDDGDVDGSGTKQDDDSLDGPNDYESESIDGQTPPEEVSQAAQAGLDSLGDDRAGIDPTILEAAEQIASRAALSAGDIEAIASLWVEHREELLSAPDGEFAAVSGLLGGEAGADWFPFALGVAVVRGELAEPSEDSGLEKLNNLSPENLKALSSAVDLLNQVLTQIEGSKAKSQPNNPTLRLHKRAETNSINTDTISANDADKIHALLDGLSKALSH